MKFLSCVFVTTVLTTFAGRLESSYSDEQRSLFGDRGVEDDSEEWGKFKIKIPKIKLPFIETAKKHIGGALKAVGSGVNGLAGAGFTKVNKKISDVTNQVTTLVNEVKEIKPNIDASHEDIVKSKALAAEINATLDAYQCRGGWQRAHPGGVRARMQNLGEVPNLKACSDKVTQLKSANAIQFNPTNCDEPSGAGICVAYRDADAFVKHEGCMQACILLATPLIDHRDGGHRTTANDTYVKVSTLKVIKSQGGLKDRWWN